MIPNFSSVNSFVVLGLSSQALAASTALICFVGALLVVYGFFKPYLNVEVSFVLALALQGSCAIQGAAPKEGSNRLAVKPVDIIFLLIKFLFFILKSPFNFFSFVCSVQIQ